jgi:hypothetical protein
MPNWIELLPALGSPLTNLPPPCWMRDEAAAVNVEAQFSQRDALFALSSDTKHPLSYKRMDTEAFQLPYQLRFSAVLMQGLFPVNVSTPIYPWQSMGSSLVSPISTADPQPVPCCSHSHFHSYQCTLLLSVLTCPVPLLLHSQCSMTVLVGLSGHLLSFVSTKTSHLPSLDRGLSYDIWIAGWPVIFIQHVLLTTIEYHVLSDEVLDHPYLFGIRCTCTPRHPDFFID